MFRVCLTGKLLSSPTISYRGDGSMGEVTAVMGCGAQDQWRVKLRFADIAKLEASRCVGGDLLAVIGTPIRIDDFEIEVDGMESYGKNHEKRL